MTERAKLIHETFKKYGSDKAEHGYADFYAQHLPENPNRILEIGVKQGASIRAWQELFPHATIHGLDLFQEFDMPKDTPGAVYWRGNQCDAKILELLRGFDFDVIIDDGSHNSRDQLITFFGLFNGAHYFIEDMHCCRDTGYRQGLPGGTTFTAQGIFEALYDATEGSMVHFGNKIVCIEYY